MVDVSIILGDNVFLSMAFVTVFPMMYGSFEGGGGEAD